MLLWSPLSNQSNDIGIVTDDDDDVVWELELYQRISLGNVGLYVPFHWPRTSFLRRYQTVWARVQLLRLLTFRRISFWGLYHLGFGLWMGLDRQIYRITPWRVRFQKGLEVRIILEPLTWVRTSSLGRFLMALEVLPSNHKNQIVFLHPCSGISLLIRALQWTKEWSR